MRTISLVCAKRRTIKRERNRTIRIVHYHRAVFLSFSGHSDAAQGRRIILDADIDMAGQSMIVLITQGYAKLFSYRCFVSVAMLAVLLVA
ncbi:hypothetical protein, partial [uncultured Mailhella sp.]|uniref:hypothetical protein n=1 Tax=uncultured Mailhella sp. TaxID=1981031 RepID=UPI0026251B45